MSDELKIKISSKEANQKLDTLKDKLTKLTKTKHKAIVDVDTTGASKRISVLQKELKKLQNQTAQSDRAKKTVEQKGPVVNKELEQLKKSNREYDKLHKKKITDLKKFTQDQIKQTDTITARRLKNQRDMDAALKKTDKTWSASEESIRRNLKKTTDQHKKRLKDLKFALKGDQLPKKDHAMYANMFDDFEKKKERARKRDLNHEKNLYASRKGGIDLVTRANEKRQKEINKSEGWFRKKVTGIQDYFNNRGPLKNQKPSPVTVAVKELTNTIKAKNNIDTKAAKQATKQAKQAKQAKKSTAASKKTKTPAITKGAVGGSEIINQLPQNAMLGRFAQFGMMASGMAATLFLFQMIAAQIVNLMNVITTWEDSLLKLIDSFKLTDEATAKLPGAIREYARGLGISSNGMSEAAGAAMEYGMSPTRENINQLYKLNYSDNTKSYKEAALVMALAGTEFGDKAATQYMKKFEAYSGKGESSGQFGYEWEKLKGSSTDAMIQIFSESDAKYGERLTDSMRNLSDWISTNRFAINTYFDGFITGLKVVLKLLKTLAPAIIAFSGLFLLTNSAKLFVWTLTSMSSLLGPFALGLVKSAEAMKALSGAQAIASATLIGWIPGLVAVGVAIAGWEIGKRIYDLYKLKKQLKEIKNLGDDDYSNMGTAEVGQRINDSEKRLASLREQYAKLQTKDNQNKGNAQKFGFFNIFDSTSEQAFIDKDKKVLNDQITLIENYKKKLEGIRDKEFSDMGILKPEGVASVEDWINGLERINKELGYMPDQLIAIKNAQMATSFNSDIGAQGLGETLLMNSLNASRNNRAGSAKLAQKHDLDLNQASINAHGFNQFDKQLFEINNRKKQLEQELSTMSFDSPGFKNIVAELAIIQKSFSELSTQSATIEMIKFQNVLDQLNRTVNQLGMTSFEKKLNNIDRMKGIGKKEKDLLKAKEVEALTHKLKKQIATWGGTDSLLEGKKRDVELSSLSKSEQDRWNAHLKYLQQAKRDEFKLNLEKQRGLDIASVYQVNLERDIKNNALKDRMNSKNPDMSKDAYQEIIKNNNDVAAFTNALNNQKRSQIVGEQTSMSAGSISDMEKIANIESRRLVLIKKLSNASLGLDAEKQKQLQTDTLIAITREEETKQIKSLINKYSTYDNLTHSGMSKETEAAKRDLIAEKAKEMEKNGRDSSGYTRSANFDLEQEKLAGSITAWGTYYDVKGGMTAEHYKNEQAIIAENYERNSSPTNKMTRAMAELIRTEDEYQLKLKNRRNLSFSEDMAVGVEEAQRKIRASYQTTGEIVETTLLNSFNGVANAMMDWITGAKDAKTAFKDMARSIISDLTRMIIKQELFNMVMGSGGGGGGGIFSFIKGLFPSAHGNVVSGISAYSNQIVSKPTIAPGASRLTAYAMGGALFGEKGPEAIMPLTRMSSGNLGVETSGGSGGSAPNVAINITNNGSNVEATQDKEPKWDGEKWVIGIVLDHAVNNKGNFRSSMKGMLSA